MKIIIMAPMGKMGKAITKVAAERENVEIVGAVGPKGRNYIGLDLGLAAGKQLGVPICDDLEQIIDKCDCIIDFSTKESGLETLKIALKHKKALVCGTTGFSSVEITEFKEAAKTIPVLYAANTSRMVGVMNTVLKILCEELGDKTDIEIIEMHDSTKMDAPSGTSLEMGKLIAETNGWDFDEAACFGRKGAGLRQKNTIGYHSIRSGSGISSHTILFGASGERLEISHHAFSNECFANGAVDCAIYLVTKDAGLYSVEDCFEGR